MSGFKNASNCKFEVLHASAEKDLLANPFQPMLFSRNCDRSMKSK
jgi:hypothetical protein